MKRQTSKDEPRESREEKFNGSKSIMKKKNMTRMGGGRGGLSLEAFANAKSRSNNYNPALIKKQREFYKNAKYVSKYKKSLKQQSEPNHLSSAIRPPEDSRGASKMNKKNRKDSSHSLRELYENKREEEEKARIVREAIIQAKKEERERSEARRKSLREKMFKKTRTGQPVMKYRIEHLLQSIQGSTT